MTVGVLPKNLEPSSPLRDFNPRGPLLSYADIFSLTCCVIPKKMRGPDIPYGIPIKTEAMRRIIDAHFLTLTHCAGLIRHSDDRDPHYEAFDQLANLVHDWYYEKLEGTLLVLIPGEVVYIREHGVYRMIIRPD